MTSTNPSSFKNKKQQQKIQKTILVKTAHHSQMGSWYHYDPGVCSYP